MDETSSPRRKSKDGSPRVTSSTGYTSEDERSNSRYMQEAIMVEFTANLERFISAHITKNTDDIENSSEQIKNQITAFKTLKQSIYGELFSKYVNTPVADVFMRSFYIGCLFQVLHPHTVYTNHS